MRALKIFGLCSVGLLLVAVCGALIYRTYRQHQNSEALAISSPEGINQSAYFKIGGLRQWVQIRGEDRRNPVLLFVHGGPALSMIPFTYRSMRAWEKYYTIVSWDQRGAGRTYFLNGGSDETATNMDQITNDGIEVAQTVRRLLHQDKIIIMGESFGSAVSLEIVRRRPDLFYAFVGTGQAVDMRRAEVLTYELVLRQVRAAHEEKAAAQLLAAGSPPYSNASRLAMVQQIESEHAGEDDGLMGMDFIFAPGYSLRECFQLIVGATQHREKMVAEDANYNAASRGAWFNVPIFFFQGSDDIFAPLSLAAEYMSAISAPQKALVVIPNGGHNAFILHSGPFLDELNVRVRPLAVGSYQPQ